jgi:hypothetical protein
LKWPVLPNTVLPVVCFVFSNESALHLAAGARKKNSEVAMDIICTLIELFFSLAQFQANNIYAWFGAPIPDVSAPWDDIFGCVR